MMITRYANKSDTVQVISLFEQYLLKDNDAIYSEEFFCSYGMKAAIRKNQMIVAIENDLIIGAMRFYRKKKQNNISLYQFAVSVPYRGRNIMMKMLELINDIDIIIKCPLSSKFNIYYQKMGWTLIRHDEIYNYWCLPSKVLL